GRVIEPSKLAYPRLSGMLTPRVDLLPRLDTILRHRLTLVVAPAGHAKTTSLEVWRAAHTLDATWVTVDAQDASLTRFGTHVTWALGARVPGLADEILPLLNLPNRQPPHTLGRDLGEALWVHAPDSGCFLILDDLHLAATSRNLAFLDGLLSTAPPGFHLVIATRVPVGLTLARLRMAGELAEVTADDLRFTEAETAALLTGGAGESASPDAVAALHRAVGGWPAAIRLVAGSQPGRGVSLLTPGASAAQREVLLAYLVEDVLQQLPGWLRELLLRAAVPEQFSFPLLQALATARGNTLSAADLSRLQALGLSREVPGSDGGWFAFHPLFRDVLVDHLRRSSGEEAVRAVHRLLARWFAAAGETGQAVRHHVAGDDIPRAVALIADRASAAFDRDDWRTVDAWLREVPPEAVAQDVELQVTSGLVAYLGGRWGRVLRTVEMLRSAAPPRNTEQQAEINLLTVLLSLLDQRDPAARIALAEQVFSSMPRQKRWRVGGAIYLLAIAYAMAGQPEIGMQRLTRFLSEASGSFDAATARAGTARTQLLWRSASGRACAQSAADLQHLSEAHELLLTTGWMHIFQGRVALERGDLAVAAAHFHRVVAEGHPLHFDCLREAFVGQTLIFQLQGQPPEIGRTLERFREWARAAENFEPLSYVDAISAQISLLQGDVPTLRAWLRSVPAAPGWTGLDTITQQRLVRARALLAVQDPGMLAEADTILAAYLAEARRQHHRFIEMEASIVQAVLREMQGQRAEALSALRTALGIAAPEDYTLRFLLLGPTLRPTLQRLLSALPGEPFAATVLQHLVVPPAAVSELQAAQAAGLTPRETEVLHCLERRLTNNEISEALYISVTTAKNHVARINAKLGVSDRRAAVERARELGILG
ncbi:MAG: hypothetical protein KC442_18335, partial [Thermomicrobiales bacterium]|nr:hypothetical protein [Thermomicrobiales bacterium]